MRTLTNMIDFLKGKTEKVVENIKKNDKGQSKRCK